MKGAKDWRNPPETNEPSSNMQMRWCDRDVNMALYGRSVNPEILADNKQRHTFRFAMQRIWSVVFSVFMTE